MKILISHVYSSKNNGDSAILSAQISELRRTFGDPEFNILTIDGEDAGQSFDGVPMFKALMCGTVSPKNNRITKLFLSVAVPLYSGIWVAAHRFLRISLPLPKEWREPMRLLVEADIQVCVGGGYLRAKENFISTIILFLLFHQVWLAWALRKPVFLYAQSFGPYPRRLQRSIARRGLRLAHLILVREGKSRRLLTSLGIAESRIVQVPDSAFMFDPEITYTPELSTGSWRSGKNVVGVTVRSWLKKQQQDAYERSMAQFIEHVSEYSDFFVVVIPQVTSSSQGDDDRVVGRRISQMVGPKDNVACLEEQFNHYDIKALYASLDYMVGTRFHSIIFSLTAGVPALAIEYEHKTSGIMQDLGLEKWVLPIESVTADNLISLFDNLVTDREIYTGKLREVLPRYIYKATETGIMIRDAYESRGAAQMMTQS